MPTTPDGIHYLDDPRELLAMFRNWGKLSQTRYDGPVQLFHSPSGKSLYASQQAFEAILEQLQPDGDGWRTL